MDHTRGPTDRPQDRRGEDARHVRLRDGTTLREGMPFWAIVDHGYDLLLAPMRCTLVAPQARDPDAPMVAGLALPSELPLVVSGTRLFAPSECFGSWESARPEYRLRLERSLAFHAARAMALRDRLDALDMPGRGPAAAAPDAAQEGT